MEVRPKIEHKKRNDLKKEQKRYTIASNKKKNRRKPGDTDREREREHN